MELEKIRELLGKYYEGNTSAEEEDQLRSFLADPGVASSLRHEYGYLAEMSTDIPEPSEGFYARLDAVTRGEAEILTGTGHLPGEPLQTRKGFLTGGPLQTRKGPLPGGPLQTQLTPRRSMLRYAMGIAAAVAVMTGTYLLFNYMGRMEMQDTYKDPEIAMAEVRSILMSVSEKMTSGTEPLGSINSMNIAPATLEELGRINSTVGESLSRLRYLDRVTGAQQNMENN